METFGSINKVKTIVKPGAQVKSMKTWNKGIQPIVKQKNTKDIAAKLHNSVEKNMHVHKMNNPITITTGNGSYKV